MNELEQKNEEDDDGHKYIFGSEFFVFGMYFK